MRRFATMILVLGLFAGSACEYVPSEDRLMASHVKEINDWRARRSASLLRDDGWLTLIGLDWLERGSNRIGSAPRNDVVIRNDEVDDWLGVIVVDEMPRVEGGDFLHARVRFVPRMGAGVTHEGRPVTEPLTLYSDMEETMTVLQSGTVSFHLIERGDKLGIRIRDTHARPRREFSGIESYPIDLRWRIEGTFHPHDKIIPIDDVTGLVQNTVSPGAIEFEVNGERHSLDVLEGGARRYFVLFSDATSGRETYGAGRYVYTDHEDEDGSIVIDFNQAYNPPCVFTDYATCPLPPRQNRLSIPIRAGEKNYGDASYGTAGEGEQSS
jgi:uncharacterized protein